jgi:hypothetical protein
MKPNPAPANQESRLYEDQNDISEVRVRLGINRSCIADLGVAANLSDSIGVSVFRVRSGSGMPIVVRLDIFTGDG